MIVDPFMNASGVVRMDRVTDEARTQMRGEALAFLRSGGVLQLSDWCGMAPATKAAFEEAFAIVQAERVAQLTAAYWSPSSALSSLQGAQPRDPIRSALEQAVDAVGA